MALGRRREAAGSLAVARGRRPVQGMGRRSQVGSGEGLGGGRVDDATRGRGREAAASLRVAGGKNGGVARLRCVVRMSSRSWIFFPDVLGRGSLPHEKAVEKEGIHLLMYYQTRHGLTWIKLARGFFIQEKARNSGGKMGFQTSP